MHRKKQKSLRSHCSAQDACSFSDLETVRGFLTYLESQQSWGEANKEGSIFPKPGIQACRMAFLRHWKTILCAMKYIPRILLTGKTDWSVKLKVKREKINAINICFSPFLLFRGCVSPPTANTNFTTSHLIELMNKSMEPMSTLRMLTYF